MGAGSAQAQAGTGVLVGPEEGRACVCSGSCRRSQELSAWPEGGLMTVSRGGSETVVSETSSDSHLRATGILGKGLQLPWASASPPLNGEKSGQIPQKVIAVWPGGQDTGAGLWFEGRITCTNFRANQMCLRVCTGPVGTGLRSAVIMGDSRRESGAWQSTGSWQSGLKILGN